MKGKINIVTGATATGKTAYAIKLAKQIDGVIINADSMQVYKEIPILTAQPDSTEKAQTEHRMYGYISCIEKYSVGIWLKDVIPEINNAINTGKTPILVGGTGMYIKSLIDGLSHIPDISKKTKEVVAEMADPYLALKGVDIVSHTNLKPNDTQRIKRALEVFYETGTPLSKWQKMPQEQFYPRDSFSLTNIALPRELLYEKINNRFLKMIENGAIEEVQNLYKKYGDIQCPKANGLYEIISYLNGHISKDEMISKTQQLSRNYAKRQLTFMRHQFKFDTEVINTAAC